MRNVETNFIFYIDNGIKRKYLIEVGGTKSWSGFDFEAKRYRHYNIGLNEIGRIPIPDGYKLGFIKIEVVKTYGKI